MVSSKQTFYVKTLILKKPHDALKKFILLVFAIHLFDSLYIRSHGDALNYHLYAPYNWIRFGFLHVNLFQSTHMQGAWYEWLIALLYKVYLPQTTEGREFILKLFQVGSCTLAYLAVPWILYKNACKKMSAYGAWLVICAYYACETALFTMQFAKNDAWAMASFLFGAFAKSPLLMMLGLGLACGIKSTYLLGSAFVILLQYQQKQRREILLIVAGVLFFPVSIWMRNYLATESWIFPLPSERGLQTSLWLKEYFSQFTVPAPQAFLQRLWDLFWHTPLYLVLCVMAGVLAFNKSKTKLMRAELFYTLIPFAYLLVTGYLLEWRTFAGVLFFAVFWLVLFIDKNWHYKRNIILPLLCVLGLASSKLDLASVTRFWSAKQKHFYDLNRDGMTFHRANQILGDKDIILTQLTNEGFFLVPQIYTANEHPAREAILSKFPVLNSLNHFIGIRTNGKCLGSGENLNFVKALLEKSEADLVRDQEQGGLYLLNLNCEPSI